jgi:hypothetical protein
VWTISFTGKLPAVRAHVQALNQTFAIPAEQATYNAAKAMALAALECIDDSKAVKVCGSGSAYATSTTQKRTGAVQIEVYELLDFVE